MHKKKHSHHTHKHGEYCEHNEHGFNVSSAKYAGGIGQGAVGKIIRGKSRGYGY